MKKFCKNVTYNGAKVICKSKNSWLFGRKNTLLKSYNENKKYWEQKAAKSY